ncbi:MAG: pyrroline-5-carboxylate reductase [Phycisphaerae bacterium]
MPGHRYALGVVGTGHIAMVILRRLIASEYLSGDRVIVAPSRSLTKHPLDVAVAFDNAGVVRGSRLIMLSVTPQSFGEAAVSIRDAVAGDHVFISVMAGVPTERVAEALGGHSVRVVRAMPNLPFELGRGVTGIYRGRHATLDDMEEVRHLFGAGGETVEVHEENLMDAVTAVAGSGPAYFYYFVEMMTAGGIAAGLKKEDAQVLAAHACVGAGAMLLQSEASPAELRAAVTSPGGTTEAAMEKLRASRVAGHIGDAVVAAFRRSQELGRKAASGPEGG